MTAKRVSCKHPNLDKNLRCKSCGVTVDIREKRNKYGNTKTVVDGQKFDSAKEARRYQDLKLMFHYGKIGSLYVQPRFPLEVNGQLICTYVADFQYLNLKTLKVVVEDVKSKATKTPAYQIKKKLMLAIHGIEIREI